MEVRRSTQFDAGTADKSSATVAASPRHQLFRGWFPRCWQTMEVLLGAATGLAIPPRCAACGLEDRPSDSLHAALPGFCGSCRDAVIPPLPDNRCTRCAAPVGPFLDTAGGCRRCSRDRFQFETVIRLGVYDSPLGQMCSKAKRPGNEELAAALAELLWDREREAFLAAQPDLVIPIPPHWRDRFRSSPHAPETLGSVLARRLRCGLATHILKKVRRTAKQSGLPPSQRRTNLKGAFHVPRRFFPDVEERRLLLVDDILTTGATADEAARALLKAGAASVVVAVVARGLGSRPATVRAV